ADHLPPDSGGGLQRPRAGLQEDHGPGGRVGVLVDQGRAAAHEVGQGPAVQREAAAAELHLQGLDEGITVLGHVAPPVGRPRRRAPVGPESYYCYPTLRMSPEARVVRVFHHFFVFPPGGGPSSTSRTRWARAAGVNGFCKKGTSCSRTP